ncbi:MAG: LysR substrate-binding domain-containing protein [Flavobacteriaceae bacterium]
MTINQLEYLCALNRFKHFGKAAKHCGVSQPTLSLMIKKVEQELEVELFDRSKHPLEITKIGSKIVEQAEASLRELNKIKELVQHQTATLDGPLHIGVIPTLAPYLIPELIFLFKKNYPEIQLTLTEMNTQTLIEALSKEEIDLFIAATPLEQEQFYEIPLYYERFVAYFPPNSPSLMLKELSADSFPKDNLWVLEEGHCLRDQTFNFCKEDLSFNQVYEAGSIETLVKIVDKNGGYSIIPELHIPSLTKAQQKNIKAIDNPPAIREISIVIKKDFIREQMINAVADSIKKIIPEHMLDSRLKKFAIKL